MTIDHIVSLHEEARDTRNDTEIRRREIEGRLKQITELYKWGDLTKEATSLTETGWQGSWRRCRR